VGKPTQACVTTVSACVGRVPVGFLVAKAFLQPNTLGRGFPFPPPAVTAADRKQVNVLVAVMPGHDRSALVRLLDQLRPALAPDDAVVVLSDDERDRRAMGRARNTSCERIGWCALIERAGSRVVVLVEPSITLVDRRWLHQLAALAQRHGAVVPATNAAPWPQCPADTPSGAAERQRLRQFSRSLSAAFGDETAPIHSPRGPVVALTATRAAAIAASGEAGRSPDLVDLACTLSALGADGNAAVARGIYVHCDRAAPLLSACMIMKDEADQITRCLESLVGLVDEIVIYDTGSTDDSVRIARDLGAIVIEGEWRDHFGWARNQALAACRSEWVMHIDADEIVENPLDGGPAMRELLADIASTDVVAVNLHNLDGSRLAPVRALNGTLVARFLRRSRVEWNGALHEQPALRPGEVVLKHGRTAVLRLLHYGYLNETIEERGKRDRNLRISRSAARSGATDDISRFDLARSLLLALQREEAVGLFEQVADSATNELIKRSSLELGSDCLREMGRLDEALAWANRHSEVAPELGVGRLLQAKALMSLNRVDEALSLVEGITDYSDRYSNVGEDGLAVFSAFGMLSLGDAAGAFEAAMRAAALNPRTPGAWQAAAQALTTDPGLDAKGHRAISDVSPESFTSVFAQLLYASPAGADAMAEAFWDAHPGSLAVLAFCSDLALRLEPVRAAVWSMRLRETGLTDRCPLPALANDETRPPRQRAEALATLVSFDGDRWRSELEICVSRCADDEISELMGYALEHALDAADSIIVAAASTARRAMALVEPLTDRGHLTEAVAVFAHAHQLGNSPLEHLDAHHQSALLDAARQMARTDVVTLLTQSQ
jgi:tetratricopeptide (TPR) repeat protein